MLLQEAIENASALPEAATLFVERIDGVFKPQSLAVSHEMTAEELQQPVRGVVMRVAPGLEYFLEVHLIHELLASWRENHSGQNPTLAQAVQCAIFYAENDAYPEEFFGA